MLTISYAARLSLPAAILAQFTLEMCVAAWNREKFTKNSIFGVQGRSRSSMLVPQVSSLAVVVCSNSVSICNRSQPFSC